MQNVREMLMENSVKILGLFIDLRLIFWWLSKDNIQESITDLFIVTISAKKNQ